MKVRTYVRSYTFEDLVEPDKLYTSYESSLGYLKHRYSKSMFGRITY